MSILRKATQKTAYLSRKLKKISFINYCSTQVIHPKSDPSKQIKPYLKKVKQPPFVKNLFLGSFNQDLLVYPEIISREDLSELHKITKRLKTFLKENVNIHQVDADKQIPSEIMNELKKMGLFGIMMPNEYGGLGFTFTEYARLAEVIGINPSISRILGIHELMGIQSIFIAGNKEQKEKFIPKLASGENISTFCLTELNSGFDPSSIQTTAAFTEDRKKIILNGHKIWITNGGIADIFIVVSKILLPERQTEGVGLIIVERNSKGIVIGKPEESLGLNGCNICSIEFKDVVVHEENLLGSPDNTNQHILEILSCAMFGIGASTVGVLKELFDQTVEYAIQRNILSRPMIENELIQEKLGKVSSKIYAIESMVYLTAGILDMVEEPDCKLENAILKVFGAEQTWWCVNQCINILGSRSYFKNYPYERLLRDSLAWNIVEGSSDMLKMYISLTGFNHAGNLIADDIRKLRNPLFNPIFAFKKIIQKTKVGHNKIKLTMDLAGHLHPTLKNMANNLEQNVIKFQHAVEMLLTSYGQNIINKQVDLKRITDIVIELYAMTAVLGRSSRSYCIGLQNSEIEIQLAIAYCIDANNRIAAIFQEMSNIFDRNDDNYLESASKLINHKGYVIEDPLKYNW